jgi:hypothetical protein
MGIQWMVRWFISMLGDSCFFFGQNQPVSVFTLCYENLISSLIILGLLRIDKGVKILNFSPGFFIKVVLAYTITVDFHIQFSQPNY